MANAFRGTLFRQRLDNVLASYARTATRHQVASLPVSIEGDITSNAKLLRECSLGLTEEQIALTLQMINTDWSQPLDHGEPLHHFCEPGCCGTEREFRARMRLVLDGLFAHLFACPLLYRWKNFDEACTWVARGMVIRGLLKQVWGLCKQDAADSLDDLVALQAMDEDNPDMNPSLRQQVRVAKVMGLLSEPDAAARCLKTLLVSRPLTTYMDKMAFLETCRSRFRLRLRGFEMKESKCTLSTLDDIVELALDVIQGRAGRSVVAEFSKMLTTPCSDAMWYDHLGLGKAGCVELLLIGAADGYRRLVLPFMCQPWQLLGMSTQSPAAALASMEAQRAQHGGCAACMDPLFSKASA